MTVVVTANEGDAKELDDMMSEPTNDTHNISSSGEEKQRGLAETHNPRSYNRLSKDRQSNKKVEAEEETTVLPENKTKALEEEKHEVTPDRYNRTEEKL